MVWLPLCGLLLQWWPIKVYLLLFDDHFRHVQSILYSNSHFLNYDNHFRKIHYNNDLLRFVCCDFMENIGMFNFSRCRNVRSLFFDGCLCKFVTTMVTLGLSVVALCPIHARSKFQCVTMLVLCGLIANLGGFTLSQRSNVCWLLFDGHFRFVYCGLMANDT